VVNAGNSNAFTGGRGRAAVAAIVEAGCAALGCAPSEVFVASTGVIGVPLPVEVARAGLASAFESLTSGRGASWREAAEAITTTDTFPKGAARRVTIGGQEASLVGIVKGSGMIAPDMATMLGFVFTDAAVDADLLQAALAETSARSFGCITVDGDTSTSDTLLAFATGAVATPRLSAGSVEAADFRSALDDLCRELAQLVVRDGEGAQKFVTIRVRGAEDDRAARVVAMSIANSPLVKTAIAGGDANWGRVVMAVGKAGEKADRDRLAIRFGDTVVARHGMAVEGYDEAPVAEHLAGREVEIAVDLGIGEGEAVVWTCDLTHGYISINADYRS
jgi:glutamate N-acetyltransferase/amino-acid N-acetyltransferase